MIVGKLYTLRMLLEEHPEWADLPIAVDDGHQFHYVNCSGSIYVGKDSDEDTSDTLIFAGN